MKRFISFFIAALMLLAFTACKGNGGTGQSGVNPPVENNTPNPGQNAGEFKLGSVYALESAGGFILKGLRLDGRASEGASLTENGKPFSTDDVRVLFELDETIDYSIEYEFSGEYAKLGVWVFPYRAISEYGDPASMEEDLHFCEYELPYETYPAPLEDMFSIARGAAQPGYYDMLITVNGEIVGCLTLSLFGEGELAGKTDAEIEGLLAVG